MSRAGLELAYQADGGVSRAEYLLAVAETLLALVGGDLVLWNDVRLADSVVEAVVHPGEGQDAAALGRQLGETLGDHPLMPSYLGERPGVLPRPRRLSDVATRGQLARNRVYVEVLRPSGARHQLTVLASPITVRSTRGWAVSRSDCDFSDTAVEAAGALQPMLALLDRTVGGTAPTSDPEAVERAGLTPRELQVLVLLAEGLTSSAMGARLRISVRTVDKHRENIHRKLARHDRLTVVRRAEQLGILSPPGSGATRGNWRP